MRNINFDASAYAAGLNGVYDATQTHFTFLDNGEINGQPGQAWLAQAGENLHVTIQSNDNPRTYVAHYFYKTADRTWRCHLRRANDPIPYGNHVHASLAGLQQKAVEFGWPPVAIVEKAPKEGKRDRRELERQAKKAKADQNKALMDELFPPRKSGPLIARPPNGRVTLVYVQGLISRNDRASLEHIFRSDEWGLSKWDSEAWSRFMDWNATGR